MPPVRPSSEAFSILPLAPDAVVLMEAMLTTFGEVNTEPPKSIESFSRIKCPKCGHSEKEEMPVNACQWFYECRNCHVLLRPKAGDCCVFCSYGTVRCPPVQAGDGCCEQK
jgi:late competence protein required for DNA uptake (superfamily II DNA/RNA helicase)